MGKRKRNQNQKQKRKEKRKLKRRLSSTSDSHTDANSLTMDPSRLPIEILSEIMSEISTKSLMKLKFVNKSWCSAIRQLFNDPAFVSKHKDVLFLNEPSVHTNSILGISSRKVFATISTVGLAVTNEIDVSDHLSDRVRVLHCNGLVCAERGSVITVFSPTMNESIEFRPNDKIDCDRSSLNVEAIGFGSDSGSTSFKVVRILGEPKSAMTAQVYELGESEDATWRDIELPIHVSKWMSSACPSEAVYTEGRCNWLVLDPPTCLSFDVAGESIRAVDLPNELVSAQHFKSHTRLANREGSLCLAYFPPWKPVEVWVMRDYQDSEKSISRSKWVKMENPPEGLGRPCYYRLNDEMVVRSDGGYMVSYEFGEEAFKNLAPYSDWGRIHYLGPLIGNFASFKWMVKHARR